MNKKNIISLICCLICCTAYPQTYYSLIDTNNLWYVMYWNECSSGGGCYSTRIYKLKKDSVINDYKYYQLAVTEDSSKTNFNFQDIFLREDTIEKKVFYIYMDNPEELLYDFSIGENDTIIINNQYYMIELIVDSIDYITVNNTERKRIQFKQEEGFLKEEWIEGIGSNYGIINVGIKYLDAGNELLCVHLNNSVIYQNPKFSYCYLSTVSIKPVENFACKIALYPNPVIEKSQLQFSSEIFEKYIIEVYDIRGKTIYHNSFFQNFSMIINKTDYSTGIYFIKIFNNSGMVTSSGFQVL